MSETKHTPGPWTIEEDLAEPNKYGIRWPSIDIEAQAMNDGYGGTICEMAIPSRGYPELDERVRVNARLIAAAPEMLEALRGMVATATRWEPGSYSEGGELEPWARAARAAMAQARAAIAKATGEGP